jgi:hypothetical protein
MFKRLERAIYPLAMLTAVVGLVYWYWTTTPQYALAAVVMSVKNHDTAMFEKYVDVDTVAARAFDDVVDGPARKVILGKYDNMIGVGFLHFFKNDMIGIAHERAVDFIANNNAKMEVGGAAGWLIVPFAKQVAHADVGSVTSLAPVEAATITPLSAVASNSSAQDTNSTSGFTAGLGGHRTKEQLQEFGLSKDGFKGYYFEQNGSQAILGLQFHSPKLNKDWVAEFKLEDAGGYWRVTELANLNALIDNYLVLRAQHHV